jgi:hypothetical protein
VAAAQLTRVPLRMPKYVCVGTLLTRMSQPDKWGKCSWELSMELQRIDTLRHPLYKEDPPRPAKLDITPNVWQLTSDTAILPRHPLDPKKWLYWQTTWQLDLLVLAAFGLLILAIWYNSGGNVRW